MTNPKTDIATPEPNTPDYDSLRLGFIVPVPGKSEDGCHQFLLNPKADIVKGGDVLAKFYCCYCLNSCKLTAWSVHLTRCYPIIKAASTKAPPEWHSKSCSTAIPSVPSDLSSAYVKSEKKGGTDWEGLKVAYEEYFVQQKISRDEKLAASAAKSLEMKLKLKNQAQELIQFRADAEKRNENQNQELIQLRAEMAKRNIFTDDQENQIIELKLQLAGTAGCSQNKNDDDLESTDSNKSEPPKKKASLKKKRKGEPDVTTNNSLVAPQSKRATRSQTPTTKK